MFKYSPINSYSLRNLQNGQIFFNTPLNFNDPFDTIHPARINEISNEKFVDFYCSSVKRKFDKKSLLAILNKNISAKDFYDFCDEHIEYLIDINTDNSEDFLKSKENFLNSLRENRNDSQNNLVENIGHIFSMIKSRIQETIHKSISEIREASFSKIGVCCFSKNNTDLLMWSHYADFHKGFCLEFDSNISPFSRYFEVTYESEFPDINSDLLFEDNNDFIEKLLSFKSIDWRYEEELRILHKESNKSYFYPAKALKAIYFGLNTDESDIEIICSLIKSKNPDVRFFRMRKKDITFGIEPYEFFYHTAMEVQLIILQNISKLFKGKEFTFLQIAASINGIDEKQLKAHIDYMTQKKILTKNKEFYRLNR